MLTAHLCSDTLAIVDADKLILRVPVLMLKRAGVERLSMELESLNRDGREQSRDLYLRGFIAAFRLLEAAAVESEPMGALCTD